MMQRGGEGGRVRGEKERKREKDGDLKEEVGGRRKRRRGELPCYMR